MSLVKTLTKVAIGVMVAKGVSGMIKQAQAGGSTGRTAGSGSSYGGSRSPGGLEDMMRDVLGGRSGSTATPSGRADDGGLFGGGTSGGIGDLLNELGGAGRSSGSTTRRTSSPSRGGGGLDDLIGGLSNSGGGGLGDLLGGLLGGAAAGGASRGGGSFGDILNQSFRNGGEPDTPPSPDQDAAAALMLRAMIQAAKADGKIDAEEQRKLLGNLGDVSAEERRFVEAEMRAPIDVEGLARQVPEGLERQIYTMSVMAIDLDNQNEAKYLHALATALGIVPQEVNTIHARLGVPKLYA